MRDWSVHGVQTCALPMFVPAWVPKPPDRVAVSETESPTVIAPSETWVTIAVGCGETTTFSLPSWQPVCESELFALRSVEHTSELQSLTTLVCSPLPEE